MKSCKPGMLENRLALKFEFGVRERGADRISFLCAAASGKNGSLLHYFHNDDLVEKGDLVTVDCGAEYQGYAAGII